MIDFLREELYCSFKFYGVNMKHPAVFFLVLAFCAAAFGQTVPSDKTYPSEDRLEAQIADATKAIQAEPNNARLYLKRADFYRFQNDEAALVADVERALGISPNDLQVQFQAVRLLYELPGRCEQALAIINTAVADNPKSAEAFEWRFRVKTCLNDLVGALDDINTALALNPQNSVYKTNQAIMQQRLAQTDAAVENFNEQIAALEEKLKTAKNAGEIKRLKIDLMMTYFSRSRLYAQAKNFDAMFADLNRAVEANPIQPAFQTRAKAYRWREMYAEAINDLTRAIELNDDDASSWMDRGEVYFLMKKFPEAIRDYEQVVKLASGLERIAERRIEDAKQMSKDNRTKP